MLWDVLQTAASIAMPVFVLSSMLAMGFGLTLNEIITPLRNPRLVLQSLVANFVVMPLIALCLSKFLQLDEPLGMGLIILGAAAGAPFLPILVRLARGNLAFAVGLMVLLMVITVGYMPIVLPLMVPGVSVNPLEIARSLFLLMLVPLAIALVLRARAPNFAGRAKPYLDRISSVSLIAVVVLLIVVNGTNVLGVIGTGGILATLLFVVLGFAAGWLLGGPGKENRRVLALGTVQRNIAAGLVVGSQSFTDPRVVVMVVVVAIIGLVTLMPLSRALAGRP